MMFVLTTPFLIPLVMFQSLHCDLKYYWKDNWTLPWTHRIHYYYKNQISDLLPRDYSIAGVDKEYSSSEVSSKESESYKSINIK